MSDSNSDKGTRKKGLEIGLESVIGGLLFLGLVVVIFNLFVGRYFDIKTIIKENEVDRHAIAYGNLLLSTGDLAYSDGTTTYRGLFDREKLNKEMVNQNNIGDFFKLFQDSQVIKKISYPDSLIGVNIIDKETGESWMLFGYGKMSVEGFSSTAYVECLGGKLKLDAQTVFRVSANTFLFGAIGMRKLWDDYDWKACEAELGDRLGTSYNTFPVAIRVSDSEVHMGVMAVRVTEY